MTKYGFQESPADKAELVEKNVTRTTYRSGHIINDKFIPDFLYDHNDFHQAVYRSKQVVDRVLDTLDAAGIDTEEWADKIRPAVSKVDHYEYRFEAVDVNDEYGEVPW